MKRATAVLPARVIAYLAALLFEYLPPPDDDALVEIDSVATFYASAASTAATSK